MEAPRIKFVLTDEQIQRFSDMMGLDPTWVEALNAIACLNTEYIRDLLIRADFNQLTRGLQYIQTVKKSYNYKELRKALARKYNTSESKINEVIQGRNNSALHFCKRCGKRITGRTDQRTHGICTSCMVDELDL